jgi:NAD(P)-dependent dehydrogenase (short-subunit alcohol dehydrogenase family)
LRKPHATIVPTNAAPISLITGASRGIGFAIARALGGTGHRVVLVARDAARLDQAAHLLRSEGIQASACAVNLREPNAAELVLASARKAFGEPTVLINNAGTAPSAKAESTSDAMLDETLDLHVRAPLRLIRAVLPGMKQLRSGTIIQLASTAGLRGFPFTLAYTAAKHAMVGLSRALHLEVGNRGIRVFAVCPGFVDTDITREAAAQVAARGKTTADAVFAAMAAQNRIGRMHQPFEVGAAIVQLLKTQPSGCVYELDRNPPAFVDEEQSP